MMMAGAKSLNQNQAMSADDDAAKKNTDCVYFLASPLTCKKGSECEYRHSEHARVNPRDCWYWLNGSCLNPKCAFRHPPLDGLLGSPSAVSAGIPFPLLQAVTQSAVAAHQSKQPVPCIFFQKGLCLKGDKCAFLHGLNSLPTKHSQVSPPDAEIISGKSVFGIPQKSAQEPKPYQPNTPNSNRFTDVKPNPKMSNTQTKPDAVKRVVLTSREFNDRSQSNRSTTVGTLSNDMHQVEIPEDYVMRNCKDADDLYRESSPGFDVLVDDELAEDQYYDVDPYNTREDREGKSVDVSHEMFHDPRGYDVHEGLASQQSRYQNMSSFDRTSRGADSLERWNDCNGATSERGCQSDLRNRLKLKKESGLRSISSNDYARDNHDRRSGDSRRECRHVAPLESSLSNRLQDRIKGPRRSPIKSVVSGRDFEMGRNLNRSSQVKSQIRDRIGSRMQDEFQSERNPRGLGEFSGPRRLLDLKSCNLSFKDRLVSGKESFSLGKRKQSAENEQQNFSRSFEGPKPLSEILKRKKRSEVIPPVSEPSEDKETNKTESTENSGINKEAYPSVTSALEENNELDYLHPSEETKTNQNEQEDGILAGGDTEDQNLEEGYEQGQDGEEYYYYEEDEGEYNMEEGETAVCGEYVEEEDGDAFGNVVDGTLL